MRHLILLLLFSSLGLAAEDWPQFRGPGGDGHSDATGVALTWSETENIRWKTEIPGEGWSSPMVLGKQIWLTTALDDGHSLRALCVERESGKIVHDVEVFHVDQPEKKNPTNSYASPSPVVEGGRVYVCFGTYGSACLSAETGRVLWENKELKLDHKEGPGSSPIIHGDLYILNCDGMDVQYQVALDKKTGSEVWKSKRSAPLESKRNDLRKAYSTPLIITVDGKEQLISVGAYRVYSYDPKTGKELWFCDLPGFSNIPRPVYGHGMVYISTGYMAAELWAIRVDGQGDVSNTHVAWKVKKNAPLKPSVLLVGDELYMLHDGSGTVTCLDPKSGEELWHEKLGGGGYSASPILVDGHIYCFSEKGLTSVLQPGRSFNRLAANQLENGCMATPAITDKMFILRTKTHLYRIEKP